MKKIMMATVVTASVWLVGSAAAQKAGQTRAQGLTMVEKRFARIDANRDGSIDLAEVTATLATEAKDGEPVKPGRAKRVLARFDADGDGKATLAEAKTAAGTRFDAADVNKDGRLDANEVAKPGVPSPPAGE